MRNYLGSRVWLWLILGSLIAVPSFAAEPAETPGQAADRLCKIERQLDDLKHELARLKETVNATVKGLERLDKLSEDVLVPTVANVSKSTAVLNSLNQEVEKLKQNKADAEKVQTLTTRLEALERQLSGVQEVQRRVYPPNLPGAPAAPPAPTGQVLLINDWLQPVQVVVDGVSFVLQPGQRQPIAKAPGMISYEVLGISGPRATTVVAGQTRNIHIHP